MKQFTKVKSSFQPKMSCYICLVLGLECLAFPGVQHVYNLDSCSSSLTFTDIGEWKHSSPPPGTTIPLSQLLEFMLAFWKTKLTSQYICAEDTTDYITFHVVKIHSELQTLQRVVQLLTMLLRFWTVGLCKCFYKESTAVSIIQKKQEPPGPKEKLTQMK